MYFSNVIILPIQANTTESGDKITWELAYGSNKIALVAAALPIDRSVGLIGKFQFSKVGVAKDLFIFPRSHPVERQILFSPRERTALAQMKSGFGLFDNLNDSIFRRFFLPSIMKREGADSLVWISQIESTIPVVTQIGSNLTAEDLSSNGEYKFRIMNSDSTVNITATF